MFSLGQGSRVGDERRFPGRFLNIQYWFQGELQQIRTRHRPDADQSQKERVLKTVKKKNRF